MNNDKNIVKGRGAQIRSHNPFEKNKYVNEHLESIDEPLVDNGSTQFFEEYPKKIVNSLKSPDLRMEYSMNPYQGCEHGCIYCYARNSHQYWGYSAGTDFESKIVIKKNAAQLLEKQLKNPRWISRPIMLSGNTDCYQPIERKLKLTKQILEVCLKYKQSVGIITKNQLILRDLDILKEMSKNNLLHVNISITTLREEIRRKLEPRTASSKSRLKVVKTLADSGIPVNVMVAPIIPCLNSDEIPEILRAAAGAGASSAAYTLVRLNGTVAEIFIDWIYKAFPDRAEKVLNQIKSCHQGNLNDSRFGNRMRGDGKVAESIAQLFKVSKQKYFQGKTLKSMDTSRFCVPGSQIKLF